MFTRRHLPLLGVAAALPRPALSQERTWPNGRAIEVIVPFAPGGGMDVMARAFLPFLQAELPGSNFVVVNRAGAGGQIGTEVVANAAPDGFTIGTAAFPFLVSTPIERPVRWKPAELTYLANLVDDPCGLFVVSTSPLRTLSDFVAAAKRRPGELPYGTAGIGGDDHIAMLMMEQAANIRLTHVPFSGTAQILPPLLAGQLDIGAFNLSEALPLLREGRIRCLGLAAEARSEEAPEVSTYREQGVNVVASAGRGFFAPPRLSGPVRDALLTGFSRAMASPGWLAAAKRQSLPLRPLEGDAFRSMVLGAEASLKSLWERHPWKD
ncbi:Bug family tripartite tricarboxylate transporter substrate binding protein [Muricoccus pecuniae]|uniref:Tripartite-type tricarboxylate transporter receptor subunit TctC n=1 Tax=Muricoccus pecuniae TaxID=693023 RepID=A0A840YN25_9PROT|nr:tripartite tricarboxylate transporter substrate binding protein [Roseomonas pecuniae]MBB5696613.1 tripartite-type tricarboxylate transporter receptor subunit TctC [Roseomonas pecuniae]